MRVSRMLLATAPGVRHSSSRHDSRIPFAHPAGSLLVARHGAGTAAGTLRELVLWFGLWVLLYGVYSPSESESGIAALPLAPNRAGEEYSLVIAVLGFVLALAVKIMLSLTMLAVFAYAYYK